MIGSSSRALVRTHKWPFLGLSDLHFRNQQVTWEEAGRGKKYPKLETIEMRWNYPHWSWTYIPTIAKIDRRYLFQIIYEVSVFLSIPQRRGGLKQGQFKLVISLMWRFSWTHAVTLPSIAPGPQKGNVIFQPLIFQGLLLLVAEKGIFNLFHKPLICKDGVGSPAFSWFHIGQNDWLQLLPLLQVAVVCPRSSFASPCWRTSTSTNHLMYVFFLEKDEGHVILVNKNACN